MQFLPPLDGGRWPEAGWGCRHHKLKINRKLRKGASRRLLPAPRSRLGNIRLLPRNLIQRIRHALVGAHVAALLDKGFAPLMAEGRTGDLARLYALLGRVGAHDQLRTALSTCDAMRAGCAAHCLS